MAENTNKDIQKPVAGTAVKTSGKKHMDDVMDKKVPKTPEPEKKPNKFMQKINALNAKREANSEKFSLINLLLYRYFPQKLARYSRTQCTVPDAEYYRAFQV